MKRNGPPQFWAKVDKSAGPDGCWPWTGYVNEKGYGQCRFDGKKAGSHRIAWELTHHESLGSREIDHRCHTRACVNPSHLRIATRKQQMENLRGPHRTNRSSGFRGVYPNRGYGWIARLRHNGEVVHVGMFKTIAEANAAVVAKRLELFTHNDIDRTA